jgi:hypothetical protein
VKTFKEYIAEETDWTNAKDPETPPEYTRWDFFFRLYHRNKERMLSDQNKSDLSIMLPPGTSLSDALGAAREAGGPSGSHITGIYEIQNDKGIYWQIHDRKIVPERTNKWRFRTWEEMEALELAGKDPRDLTP